MKDMIIRGSERHILKRSCDMHIVLEEGAQGEIIDTMESNFSGRLIVTAKKNSRLKWISVKTAEEIKDYKEAIIGDGAVIDWIEIDASMNSASFISSQLKGMASVSNITSIYVCRRVMSHDFSITHEGMHSACNIISKGILKNNAKVLSKGLIHILPGASQSKGYQKADVLLLSPTAEARLIPRLKVDDNNVICGHSATVSHIDKDKLFYLMSRGLSSKSATVLMIEAFLYYEHIPQVSKLLELI